LAFLSAVRPHGGFFMPNRRFSAPGLANGKSFLYNKFWILSERPEKRKKIEIKER
jgi:hypothetical protein